MNFFIDRCVPIRLARIVNAFETDHRVVHLDDDSRFHSRTTDVEWMTALAADGDFWAVLSADQRITRNPVERRVLKETQLKFFYLARRWNQMPFHERAWRLIKVWPGIVE